MIGHTISHYKILEKLGEGGMGVVYKALDTKLNRIVALKFLPERVAHSEQDRARFLQEAKAAASLNHQNICTIYGIEEHGENLFIVMEYVDGTTLRARTSDANQKLETILSYATQIGEALNEAHSRGIVHRDVKAENIMVNAKGQIKVMDFGLAKLKGALKLTKTSSTVGTIGYMAPEQIQGGEVDARSDIFSFGVVVFEMLTGHLPFRGEHEAAMMYSIVNENPIPLEKYRPDVAAELALILVKALEKNPEDRYQSVAEMVIDLRRVRKSSGLLPTQTGGIKDTDFGKAVEKVGYRTTAIPLHNPRKGRALYLAIGLLVMALAIGGYFLFFQGQSEEITSLAVMPFSNATGDQSLEYLTDGITENIINNLSRLSSLRVMSRASVFRFKGKEIDPKEVGNALGVQAILTGRMTQRPNGFSINVELVDSRDSRQIWGDQYTRSLSDFSTLETEIPRAISGHLQITLSGEEQAQLTTVSTANAEAYQLYLKGRYNWNTRRPDALRRAIDLFSQAIERDPRYAQAYAAIAETYVIMPVYLFPPPRDTFDKAKDFALKALELNPNLAEARAALAHAKWSVLDLEGAEQDYKRAIEMNPNYATGHHWYSLFLTRTKGSHDDALREMLRAQELDPLSLVIQTSVGSVHAVAGRYHEAIAVYKEVFKTDPDFPLARLFLGSALLKLGRGREAIAEFEKAKLALGDTQLPFIAEAYALQGNTIEARKILAKLENLARDGERLEGAISLVYLAMGDKKNALVWLEKTANSRYINISYYQEWRSLPKLVGLDSDPEIQQALLKIGLTMR